MISLKILLTKILNAIASKQNTITGGASTITSDNLTASKALVSDSSGKVAVSSVSSTELGYISGVTSSVQTQLNGKQASITGGASTIADSNLTASRALVSNSSGKVVVSDVTSTELGYLDGVTSSIQTQLNGKQASVTGGASTITGSNLTASRALVSNSSGKVAVSAVTSTELGYLDGVTSNIQTQINDAKNTISNNNGSNITLATATWKTVAHVELTAGGYLLVGTARFAANANGARVLKFSLSADNNEEVSRYAYVSVRPIADIYTYTQVVFPHSVTSTTTVYLNVYQNSGGNLAVANPGIRVIKLY